MKHVFLFGLILLSLLAVPVAAEEAAGLVAGKAGAGQNLNPLKEVRKDLIDARKDVRDSLKDVRDAKKDLIDARKDLTKEAKDVKEAFKEGRKEVREELKEAKDALKEVREARKDVREEVKNLAQTRGNVLEARKERGKKLQEVVAKNDAVLRQRVAKFDAKAREQRQKVLNESKQKVKHLEQRIDDLKKRKAILNQSEKKELGEKVVANLQAMIDNRIKAALKLEADGADPTTVKNFTDFAEAKKTELGNANTTQAKNEIIASVNQKWQEFHTAVAKSLFAQKLENGLQKAAELLTRIDGVIVKLKEKGFNTAQLESRSTQTAALIKETTQGNWTVQQATWRLSRIQVSLVHLKNAIQRVANKQSITPLPEATPPAEVKTSTNATVAVSSEAATAITQVIEA